MKENKEIEKILMNDEAYNKLIISKIEDEFASELKSAKSTSKAEITELKKVPKDKIFSTSSVFLIMNKNSKTKSFINGVQAEGFLGTQYSDREKLLNAEIDSFISGNNFIKFIKAKV
ncbi:MAG: hypothetical protein E7Z87_03655 [Cyanobacteria bacterium SIG26]|nr:hypothetical protein [Cyanobacteria bacterium SIG26]MBQ7126208.1 hypothetical protein [bacterium]